MADYLAYWFSNYHGDVSGDGYIGSDNYQKTFMTMGQGSNIVDEEASEFLTGLINNATKDGKNEMQAYMNSALKYWEVQADKVLKAVATADVVNGTPGITGQMAQAMTKITSKHKDTMSSLSSSVTSYSNGDQSMTQLDNIISQLDIICAAARRGRISGVTGAKGKLTQALEDIKKSVKSTKDKYQNEWTGNISLPEIMSKDDLSNIQEQINLIQAYINVSKIESAASAGGTAFEQALTQLLNAHTVRDGVASQALNDAFANIGSKGAHFKTNMPISKEIQNQLSNSWKYNNGEMTIRVASKADIAPTGGNESITVEYSFEDANGKTQTRNFSFNKNMSLKNVATIMKSISLVKETNLAVALAANGTMQAYMNIMANSMGFKDYSSYDNMPNAGREEFRPAMIESTKKAIVAYAMEGYSSSIDSTGGGGLAEQFVVADNSNSKVYVFNMRPLIGAIIANPEKYTDISSLKIFNVFDSEWVDSSNGLFNIEAGRTRSANAFNRLKASNYSLKLKFGVLNSILNSY